MRLLSNPRAQTVKALAQDAMERNCIVSSHHSKDVYQQKRPMKTKLSDDRDNKRARHNNIVNSSKMSLKNLSNRHVPENGQRSKTSREAKQHGPVNLQDAESSNTRDRGDSNFSLKHSLNADDISSDDDSSSSDDTSSSDSDSSSDDFVKLDSKAELHGKAVNNKDRETNQQDFPRQATEDFPKQGAEDDGRCQSFTKRKNEDYESDCKLEDTQLGLDSSPRKSATQPGIKGESNEFSVRSYGDNRSDGGL